MDVKGVCYDVGRVMMGSNWRPKFDMQIVKRELDIIKNDLHASAVRICGLDLKRLELASEAALSIGLEVWFSPEMWDRSQEDTIEYLIEAAKKAERLRSRYKGRIIFSVGSELTLFMNGILEGENFFKRINSPSFAAAIHEGSHNRSLKEFLHSAVESVREVFYGPLTYFSVPLEDPDWSDFDFIGVDLYRDDRIRAEFQGVVSSYVRKGKPVIIGEFGCCTYAGAEKLGGSGFVATFGMLEEVEKLEDKLPPVIKTMISIPPKKEGHYIRDEGLQAREITDQLQIFASSGVHGAFVFTFLTQNSPFSTDPMLDTDMLNYSLVKSYPIQEMVDKMSEEFTRMVKNIFGENMKLDPPDMRGLKLGEMGTTYPDMQWEPKESFWAVADFYDRES